MYSRSAFCRISFPLGFLIIFRKSRLLLFRCPAPVAGEVLRAGICFPNEGRAGCDQHLAVPECRCFESCGRLDSQRALVFGGVGGRLGTVGRAVTIFGSSFEVLLPAGMIRQGGPCRRRPRSIAPARTAAVSVLPEPPGCLRRRDWRFRTGPSASRKAPRRASSTGKGIPAAESACLPRGASSVGSRRGIASLCSCSPRGTALPA